MQSNAMKLPLPNAGKNITERKVLEYKLNDNFADCQTMQTEEHFKYGFTMGVLLMKEIYELPDFK